MLRSRWLMVLMVLGWSTMSEVPSAYPDPYRPIDDTQVLERLRFKATDPAAREIESLRADLRNNPRHLESAVKLATRYIERANGSAR